MYNNEISMEFLQGSGGIYRPVRVLFYTPIYDRALELCWTISSYESQIALLVELLRLQEKNQIPSQMTVEDMSALIFEKSKNTLRERLWEFELEAFDDDETKPLLMLVWAVNMSNKMRDVEFEATMLSKSPEPLPPNFLHPKVLSIANNYAKILREMQREAPSSTLLSPHEVVMEVVPRVLQGLWVLPPRQLLNMPSQKLSKLSVGVTKATLDQVSSVLTAVEHQATFSRCIRDDVVLSILTEIRHMYPLDILVNSIKNFAPELLGKIVGVAVGKICGMFQAQSAKVSVHLTPPVGSPVQDYIRPDVAEQRPTARPNTYCGVASPAPPTPTAEPASFSEIEAKNGGVDEDSKHVRDPYSVKVPDFLPPTPPVQPVVLTAVEGLNRNVTETEPTPCPHIASGVVSPPSAPFILPAPHGTDTQNTEVTNEKACMENDFAVVVNSPAPPSPPREPVVNVIGHSETQMTIDHSETQMTTEKRAKGFFRWLSQPLTCCCANSHTD